MRTYTRRGALRAAGAVCLACVALSAPAWAAAGLGEDEMRALLTDLDARQRAVGDYQAQVFIDQKRKGKTDIAYLADIYRRDKKGKLVILFRKPKSEAGKGYLRVDSNLFLYDPSVGKWERRTDRESIGGTASQRRDFDASSFADDYDPAYAGTEKLGKFETHHLKLTAKEGKDVAYPSVEIWVDKKSGNLLKLQEFALSGRLMRTSYYPKWAKVASDAKGAPVYFPKQIRIFDEVEKDNKTTIVMKKVELDALPDSIFTKAWLESKSR